MGGGGPPPSSAGEAPPALPAPGHQQGARDPYGQNPYGAAPASGSAPPAGAPQPGYDYYRDAAAMDDLQSLANLLLVTMVEMAGHRHLHIRLQGLIRTMATPRLAVHMEAKIRGIGLISAGHRSLRDVTIGINSPRLFLFYLLLPRRA